MSISHGPTLRAAVGSVLYLVLIALLSLGVATAIRDTAVSIGVVLGLLYLPPILAQAVTDPLRRHLQQIAPMTAGLAIQATTNLHSLPITPWAGLGVLAAWATAALLAGGLSSAHETHDRQEQPQLNRATDHRTHRTPNAQACAYTLDQSHQLFPPS